MTDKELQSYISKRAKNAPFVMVPGHIPAFQNVSEVDKFFNGMETQINAFEQRDDVTRYQLDMMAHAIALDYLKPYTRNGKRYYNAYRNHYSTTDSGIDYDAWNLLVQNRYAESFGEGKHNMFHLTEKGLDYVAKKYGICRIRVND